MFVQVFETHRVFETANYLALHLPYDLEIFTEDVFMHDIYCPKFLERESKICVLEARFCAFQYIRQTKVWNVFSDPSRSAWPFILKLFKCIQIICEGLNTKFHRERWSAVGREGKIPNFACKSVTFAWHSPAKLSSSLSQIHCDPAWQQFQTPDIFEPWVSERLRQWTQNIYTKKK